MPKSLSRAQPSGRILSPGLIQHGSGDVTWNLTSWESFDTPFPEIDEANTASDIIALVSGYIQSDNAVVGETNPISAGISLSDSSVASDSPSTVFVVVVSDNATANEAESISGVRAQSDGNTISETNSVNATVTGIDSSAQSDSANASVLIAVSDTASESEGLNLIGSPAIADSGTVSETRLNSGSISNADNTVESETELLTGGRLQADSAGENETVNQSAIVTANDSSAISDSESINGNFSGAPDASSASELRLLAAGILINDANNSIEAFSGSASMVQADTCLANDTSFNSTNLTASDQAIGAESNSYQGNTNRSDLSNSGEGLVVEIGIVASDSSSGLDQFSFGGQAMHVDDSDSGDIGSYFEGELAVLRFVYILNDGQTNVRVVDRGITRVVILNDGQTFAREI